MQAAAKQERKWNAWANFIRLLRLRQIVARTRANMENGRTKRTSDDAGMIREGPPIRSKSAGIQHRIVTNVRTIML